MVEGNHLALLTERVVVVNILQGVGAILTRSDALDDEMAPAVGPADTHERLRREDRVVKIVVETDENALHGLQVGSVEHES